MTAVVTERELADQLEIRAARRRTDAEIVTGSGPILIVCGVPLPRSIVWQIAHEAARLDGHLDPRRVATEFVGGCAA